MISRLLEAVVVVASSITSASPFVIGTGKIEKLIPLLFVGMCICGPASANGSPPVIWDSGAGANSHCYLVVTDKSSWTAANTSATSSTYNGKQGYLATITSVEELAFLNSILLPFGQADPTGYGNRGFFLGGSDAASEGNWQWVSGPDNGTAFFFANGDYPWSPIQPDNFGGQNYVIASIGDSTFPFYFDDVSDANPFPTSPSDGGSGHVVEFDEGCGSTVDSVTGTQGVITNFLARRADLITANDPSLVERLSKRGGASNSDAPVGFAASGTLDHFNLAFATSLNEMENADASSLLGDATRAVAQAALGQLTVTGGADAKAATQAVLGQLMAYGEEAAVGGVENGQYVASGSGGADLAVGYKADEQSSDQRSRFDVWAEGQWGHTDDETRDSDFALLNFGADYLVNPSLLVGVLAQIDWMDETDTTENTSTDGIGWMAGPYIVAQLHQNLYFDGRVAWGQSYNHVDPLGLYTDDFDTNRWLAKAQLTGDFRMDNWRFSPHIAAIYFEENQKAYTDSLNVLIPSQTISLGRVTFGPEFSYVHHSDGMEVEPHFALKGIWDFDKAEIVDLTSGLAAGSTADLRARVESGIAFRFNNGASLTGEAFYDGIGVDDLDMYGGSAKVTVPLN